MAESYSHEKVVEAAEFLKGKISQSPDYGIICGTGLGGLGEKVEGGVIIKYEEIPNFPQSTVQGHKGQLVCGKLGDKSVICMQGRFHPYEGYAAWKIALPIRTMKLLGVKTVIITNAAGAINRLYKAGDFMILKDHISFNGLAGYNPLTGPNDEKFGPRFPAVTPFYDIDLRARFKETAVSLGLGANTHEGVYCQVAGPSFETVAEIQMMSRIGGDAVGASTAQEVVAAAHCGLKVCCCSLITNECIHDYDTTAVPNQQEVMETSKQRTEDMQKLVTEFLRRL